MYEDMQRHRVLAERKGTQDKGLTVILSLTLCLFLSALSRSLSLSLAKVRAVLPC